jgi:hypothetical protein
MINIKKIKENENQFIFLVSIDSDGKTEHKVIVDKDYYKQITNEKMSVEDLVKKSFEFLLERESNQSILKEFNLRVISDYFPEYEKILK